MNCKREQGSLLWCFAVVRLCSYLGTSDSQSKIRVKRFLQVHVAHVSVPPRQTRGQGSVPVRTWVGGEGRELGGRGLRSGGHRCGHHRCHCYSALQKMAASIKPLTIPALCRGCAGASGQGVSERGRDGERCRAEVKLWSE